MSAGTGNAQMSDGTKKKVVVVGATGTVGTGVIQEFARRPEWEIVGISRRPPKNPDGDVSERVSYLQVDLLDEKQCVEVGQTLSDVTHVVYAAVYEEVGDVVAGWRSGRQMETNERMIRNILSPLEGSAEGLRHVSLLQGGKAYGFHLVWPDRFPAVPAREREPRHQHDNFYWLQEDFVRGLQEGKDWAWTIWRPHLVIGGSVGSNLSALAVLTAYGVLEREAGRGMAYTGGPRYAFETTDVDLLARAIAWATDADTARNEIFNVTNGDVFVWENIWNPIADALGVEVAPPKPQALADTLPPRQDEWAKLVDKYELGSPSSLDAFIGGSPSLLDSVMAYGVEREDPPPLLESTVKLRQAGFGDCIDTEDMFRKWIKRLQDRRLIPPREV
jgi:nucleoside-diphosphate-sugar epimerase